MSIFDYLFDNEFRQRGDINELRQERKTLARRLESESDRARELQERVEALEEDVNELASFSRALLRMIVDFEVCTYDEFAQSLAKVRREQAEEDAAWRAGEDVQPCPECDRKLQRDNTWCIYCGYRAEAATAQEPRAAPEAEAAEDTPPEGQPEA